MENIIILYIFIGLWYIFCTIGFYFLTTNSLTLNYFDKIIIFILCLFFPLILGILGFATIMTELEYKITGRY